MIALLKEAIYKWLNPVQYTNKYSVIVTSRDVYYDYEIWDDYEGKVVVDGFVWGGDYCLVLADKET